MSKTCKCGAAIGVRHNQCTACWGVNEMMANNPKHLAQMILEFNASNGNMEDVPVVHRINHEIEIDELQTQKAQMGIDMLNKLEKMTKGLLEAFEIARVDGLRVSFIEKTFNEIIKEVSNVYTVNLSGSDGETGTGAEHSCDQVQAEAQENAE